jgi:integrase
VNLCWKTIDLDKRLIRVTAGKTGMAVVLHMHEDFVSWLLGRPGGIGKVLFFQSWPESASVDTGPAQFRDVVTATGIITGRVVAREEKKRATNSKSFHALRYSFVSGLANARVHPHVRQILAGRADSKVHANYTHHPTETLRAAIDKLPTLRRTP